MNEWQYRVGAPVISVASDSEGQTVIAGAVDRRIYLLDGSGNLRHQIEVDHEVWSVAAAPIGDIFAAGTASKKPAMGTLYILDKAGTINYSLPLSGPVWGVAISPDSRRIAATTWTGAVHVVDQSVNGWHARQLPLEGCGSGLYGIQFLNSGNQLAVAEYDRGIWIMDLENKRSLLYPIQDGM